MGNVLRLFSLVVIFFSASAHAGIYWIDTIGGPHWSSAAEACSYYSSVMGVDVSLSFYNNNTGATCDGNITLAQVGSSCDAGAQYNASTGGCAVPAFDNGQLCPDQTGARTAADPMVFDSSVGKCVLLTDTSPAAYCQGAYNMSVASGGSSGSSYQVSGTVDRAGNLIAPPTFAQQGTNCQLATIGDSECKLTFSGASICNVTGVLTGQMNSASGIQAKDAACGPGAPNGSACADVQPTTQNQNQPCTLSGPSSSQGCTSVDQTITDGSQSCQGGSVNGVYTCVTKPPTSNGLKIDTTVSSTTNADGSADVVKTDNATKTTCTDIGVCTSQTSTTTTTTHTSATGGTNTTTTCKGTCNSDGTGLTPGKGGTGNGDGSGGGQASASDDCSKPVVCDGDIFQCAILNQQYLDMCTLRKLPTDAEKQQLADSITAENTEIAANQKELDDTASSVFSTFKAAASGSGGSTAQCLPDYPFSVMGRNITMKFSAACDYLAAIRYAILCIAYLIASRIISKEL